MEGVGDGVMGFARERRQVKFGFSGDIPKWTPLELGLFGFFISNILSYCLTMLNYQSNERTLMYSDNRKKYLTL